MGLCMRRFYLPDLSNPVLEGEEAHHMRKVLRMRPSDSLSVFDGKGRELQATLSRYEGGRAVLELGAELTNTVESPAQITLVQGLSKGERFEIVLQKAVELGVSRVIPLISRYTDIKVTEAGRRMERWRRIVLEATKQSGRRQLAEVGQIVEFSGLRDLCRVPSILFAERGGRGWKELEFSSDVILIVGSEGGWSGEELERAAQWGAQLVTLGPRILRTETAGVVAVALAQTRVGDMS